MRTKNCVTKYSNLEVTGYIFDITKKELNRKKMRKM